MEKMTKLTNEELRQALEEIRMIASGETEPKDGEDAEDALVTIDNICKRMAEGAAGEASPQGDLLAALKACLPMISDHAAGGRRLTKPADARSVYAMAQTAIKNYESGSASTAGPRAKKADDPATCNHAVIRPAIMHEDAGDRKAYCCEDCATEFSPTAGPRPRCPECQSANLDMATFQASKDHQVLLIDCQDCETNFSVTSNEGVYKLIDFTLFFAAAPAEAAKEAAIAITKMVDMWLEKMNLPTSNKEGKQIFTQTVQDLIQLALLRRVSGKGAQACSICRLEGGNHLVGCGHSSEVQEILKDAVASLPSPAPVPATPDIVTRLRCIGGKLRTDLHDAATVYPEHFHAEGLKQLIAEWDEAVSDAVRQMTTQGTPAGAK